MKLRGSNYRPQRKHIIKQEYYNLAVQSNSKEDRNQIPFRELKSTTKSKGKLRNYLFKNKKLVTQETYLSPYRKDITGNTSIYFNFTSSPAQSQTYSQLKSQRVQRQRIKDKYVQIDNQPIRQPQKKQKREFKLIYQMKRQKAKKNKQKTAGQTQKSHIIFEQNQQLQFPGLKTMQNFTQQLQEILQPIKESEKLLLNKIQQPQLQVLLSTQSSTIKQIIKRSMIIQQSNQNTKESNNSHQQLQTKPDLNRSIRKANQILKKRKDSMGSSSSEISFRQSKVKEQISLSLALYSRTDSRMGHSGLYKEFLENKPTTILDKLNIHLSILRSLSNFVVESTNFDANSVEWQQLNFLIYKKYYIERVKIVNFLKRYPMKNPFYICDAEISAKQIIQFMKKQQGKSFKQLMIKQTKQIKEKLLIIYNHFEKHKLGERINLFQCDNFSNWLIQELWAELILTQYDAVHLKEEVNIRLCRLLQTIFLISQLNGKYEFPFEQAEIAINNKQYGKYIKQGKAAFEQYILYQNF